MWKCMCCIAFLAILSVSQARMRHPGGPFDSHEPEMANQNQNCRGCSDQPAMERQMAPGYDLSEPERARQLEAFSFADMASEGAATMARQRAAQAELSFEPEQARQMWEGSASQEEFEMQRQQAWGSSGAGVRQVLMADNEFIFGLRPYIRTDMPVWGIGATSTTAKP